MPVNNDRISKLYGLLKSKGIQESDMGGSEENFRNNLKDPTMRDKFYNWVVKQKKINIGDKNVYDQRIAEDFGEEYNPKPERTNSPVMNTLNELNYAGAGVQSPKPKEKSVDYQQPSEQTKQAPSTGADKFTMPESSLGEQTGMPVDTFQQWKDKQAPVMPSAKETLDKAVPYEAQGTFVQDFEAQKKRQAEWDKKELERKAQEGDSYSYKFDPEWVKSMQAKEESKKVDPNISIEDATKRYMDAKSKFAKDEADVLNIYAKDPQKKKEALSILRDSQIDELSKLKAVYEKKINDRESQIIARQASSGANGYVGTSQGGFNVAENTFKNDPEVMSWSAALNQINDALKLVENAKKLKKSEGVWGGFFEVGNNTKNFLAGAKDKAFDLRTWDNGETAVREAAAAHSISKKMENGQKLSEAEKAYATLMGVNNDIQQQYADALPRMYKAGETTVEMAPFMAQMAINPGKGVEGSLTKKAIEKFGEKGLKATLAKAGAIIAEDLASSAILAGTVQAQQTASNVMNRMAGQAVLDENGNVEFTDKESGLEALYKGVTQGVIENFTEMMGEYGIPKLVGKGTSWLAKRAGLGRVVNWFEQAAESDFNMALRNFEKQTKWSGNFGELLEEEYGIILNRLLGTSDARNADGSKQTYWEQLKDIGNYTSLDEQIDIALGVGCFGAFMSGLHTVGGINTVRKIKTDLDTAEGNASKVLKDEWNGIKEAINSAEEKNLATTIRQIAENKKPEEVAAILQYAGNLSRWRGINIGLETSKESKDNISRELISSYSNGIDLEGADINKAGKVNRDARESLINLENGEEMASIIDAAVQKSDLTGITTALRLAKTEEEKKAAEAYAISSLKIAGASTTARSAIEAKKNNYRTTLEDYSEKSGDANKQKLVGATLLGLTPNEQPKEVWVINNNGSTATVRDKETGEVHMATSSRVTDAYESNVEQEVADWEANEGQQMRNDFFFKTMHHENTHYLQPGETIQTEDGNVLTFQQSFGPYDYFVDATGQIVPMPTEETLALQDAANYANDKQAEVEQQAVQAQEQQNIADSHTNDAESALTSIEGGQKLKEQIDALVSTNKDLSLSELMSQFNSTILSDYSDGQLKDAARAYMQSLVEQEQAGESQAAVDEAVASVEQQSQEALAPVQSQEEQTAEIQGEESAVQEVPRDADGNVDYDKIEDSQMWADSAREEFGEDAYDTALSEISNVQKELDKLKGKSGIDINRKKNRLKARIKMLTDVANILAPKDTDTSGKEGNAVDGADIDITMDTPAAARERGYVTVNGNRVDRKGAVTPLAEGNEAEVRFGSDNADVAKAKYVLLNVKDVAPSHRNKVPVPEHFFLSEGQPKERTDEASQTSVKNIATNPNETGIVGMSAYEGAPVINARGEVIQGNNRQAGFEQMTAEAEQKYREMLKQHAAEFGFTAEQIDQMPVGTRLYRLADVADEEAIRLGNKTRDDMESGGTQHINAANTAQLLRSSGKVNAFVKALLVDPKGGSTINRLIRNNGANALRVALDAGAITQTQYNSAVGNGSMNGEAILEVEKLLTNLMLGDATARMKTGWDAMDEGMQSVVLLAYGQDLNTSDDTKLMPEIRNAIELFGYAQSNTNFVKASNLEGALKALSGALAQTSITESQYDFSPIEKLFAAEIQGVTPRDFKAEFQNYYDLVRNNNSKQMDMFGNESVSKDEAIGKVWGIGEVKTEQEEKTTTSTDNAATTQEEVETTQEEQTTTTNEPKTPTTNEPKTPTTNEPKTPTTSEPKTPTTNEPKTPSIKKPGKNATRAEAQAYADETYGKGTKKSNDWMRIWDLTHKKQSKSPNPLANKMNSLYLYAEQVLEAQEPLTAEEEAELKSLGVQLGADFVRDGNVKFADFFNEMVLNFGDNIRPYTKFIYGGISNEIEDEYADQMDDRKTVRDFDINTPINEENDGESNADIQSDGTSVGGTTDTETDSNEGTSEESGSTGQGGITDDEGTGGRIDGEGSESSVEGTRGEEPQTGERVDTPEGDSGSHGTGGGNTSNGTRSGGRGGKGTKTPNGGRVRRPGGRDNNSVREGGGNTGTGNVGDRPDVRSVAEQEAYDKAYENEANEVKDITDIDSLRERKDKLKEELKGYTDESLRDEQNQVSYAELEGKRDACIDRLKELLKDVKRGEKAIKEEKIEYIPMSDPSGEHSIPGTVVPSAVAEYMEAALRKVEAEEGKPIAQFVQEELQYKTEKEMWKALSAEQVDGVALSIHAMKNGRSMIIGDMTGVGKGRQGAAIIRWAKLHGKKTIFMTESPDLYTAMYQDMADIGTTDLVPFCLNSGKKEANITDDEGRVIIQKPSAEAQKNLFKKDTDALPNTGRSGKGKPYDFLMCTYSNFSGSDAEESIDDDNQTQESTASRLRKEWVQRYAKDAVIVFDESHNAGGMSNTGKYCMSLLEEAYGATFMSATYAKRPEHMVLYTTRSAIKEVSMPVTQLVSAIENYGVPMQEILAGELFKQGEMVRRERDFKGVESHWVDPKELYEGEEYDIARNTVDETTDVMRAISEFQRDYVAPALKDLENSLRLEDAKNGVDKKLYRRVTQTKYSSQTSNVMNVLIYAIKVKKAADMAIQQIKEGKKPVIAVDNTLDAQLQAIVDSFKENNEDPFTSFDDASFGRILERGIDFSLKYRIKKGRLTEYEGKAGEKDDTFLPDMGAEAENAKRWLELKIKDYAKKLKMDLTISPLDAIKKQIEEAGYRCGEITGRANTLVKEENGKYHIEPRKKPNKKSEMFLFNGGSADAPLAEDKRYDALILNRSGATGISLHASSKFGDQRPRTMIILQSAPDINKEVQMRGRIDRTGQIHRGEYFYISSPIPSEYKTIMMLRQKLASLDANAVGTQDVSSNKVNADDMDNKYGDEVAYAFLKSRTDFNARLNELGPYGLIEKKGKRIQREEQLYQVLKGIQLLDCDTQDEILAELQNRFVEQIEFLNEQGLNDLVVTTMNLEAEKVDKAVFVKGTDSNSSNIFAQDTMIERISANLLRKPMRASDTKKEMKKLGSLIDVESDKEVNKGKGTLNTFKAVVAAVQDLKDSEYTSKGVTLQYIKELMDNPESAEVVTSKGWKDLINDIEEKYGYGAYRVLRDAVKNSGVLNYPTTENGGVVEILTPKYADSVSTRIEDKVLKLFDAKLEDNRKKYEEAKARAMEAQPRKDNQTEEDYELMIENSPNVLALKEKQDQAYEAYKNSLTSQLYDAKDTIRNFKAGKLYFVPLTDEVSEDFSPSFARFLGYQMADGSPRNVKAIFAVKDGRAKVSIPIVGKKEMLDRIYRFSEGDIELASIGGNDYSLTTQDKMPAYDEKWDSLTSSTTNRSIRYVITGNILQACPVLGKHKGNIVTFTRRDPDTGDVTTDKGLLLTEDFDPETFVITYEVKKDDFWNGNNEIKDSTHNISVRREGDKMVIRFEKRDGQPMKAHPALKDKVLNDPDNGVQKGMTYYDSVEFDVVEDRVEEILSHLASQYTFTGGRPLVMPDSTEKVDRIVPSEMSDEEVINTFKPKYGRYGEGDTQNEIDRRVKRYKMDTNNEELKESIKELVQLRQAFIRKKYGDIDDQRLAWAALAAQGEAVAYEQAVLNDPGNAKKYRPYKELALARAEALKDLIAMRGEPIGHEMHLSQHDSNIEEVKTLFEQLNTNKENGERFSRLYAKLKDIGIIVKFNEKIDNGTAGQTKGGNVVEYNWKFFNSNWISDQMKADTILHELVHVMEVYLTEAVRYDLTHLTPELEPVITDLSAIYLQIKNNKNFTHSFGDVTYSDYGVSNVDEMITEGSSNEEFRNDLRKVMLIVKNVPGRGPQFYDADRNSGLEGGKKVSAHDAIMERIDYLIDNFDARAWKEICKATRRGDFANAYDEGGNDEISFRTTDFIPGNSSNKDDIRKAVQSLADELNTDVVIADTVTEFPDAVQKKIEAEKERSRKSTGSRNNTPGFYHTGKVYIILSDCADVNDGIRTVLHETVGHKGLRSLIGEDKYVQFLSGIYELLSKPEKEDLHKKAEKYGWNMTKAMDEWLAEKAEDNKEYTLWDRISRLFNKLFRGWHNIGSNLNDADVRYLLWRSRKKLTQDDDYDFAKDSLMKRAISRASINDGRTTNSAFSSRANKGDIVEWHSNIPEKLRKDSKEEIYQFASEVKKQSRWLLNIFDESRDKGIISATTLVRYGGNVYFCSVEEKTFYTEVFDAYEITPENKEKINAAAQLYIDPSAEDIFDFLQEYGGSGEPIISRIGDMLRQSASRNNTLGNPNTRNNGRTSDQSRATSQANGRSLKGTTWKQLDAAYISAVTRGDTKFAQRCIRAAASRMGYTWHGYHSTPNADISSFESGHRSSRPLNSLDDLAAAGWFSNFSQRRYGNVVYDVYIKMENPYVISGDSEAMRTSKERVNKALEKKNRLEREHDNDGVSLASIKEVKEARLEYKEAQDAYEELKFEKEPFWIASKIGEEHMGDYPNAKTYGEAARLYLQDQGYDGVILQNTDADMAGGEDWFLPFYGGSQVKSSEITRREDGSLIPLVERFDTDKEDISFRSVPSNADPIQKEWDEIASSTPELLETAMVDQYHPVKSLQRLYASKFKKAIPGYQDVYGELSKLGGVNRSELDKVERTHVTPLIEAINDLLGDYNPKKVEKTDGQGKKGDWDWVKDPELRRLTTYLQLKHGIERNRDMAVRKELKRKATTKYNNDVLDIKEKYETALTNAITSGDSKEEASIRKQIRDEIKALPSKQDRYEEKLDKFYADINTIRNDAKLKTWEAKQKKMDEVAKKLGADVNDEYAGVGKIVDELVPGTSKQDTRDAAYALVNQYESDKTLEKVQPIHDALIGMSSYILAKQQQSGLVDEAYIKDQARRYEFYVPLRGFDEPTADQMYNYIEDTSGYEKGNPVKKANGRGSIAANPLANMMSVLNNTIVYGNRNMALQRFYNLVNAHPSGLAKITQRWLVNEGDEDNPVWEEKYPVFDEKDDASTIAQTLEDFNAEMRELKKQGKAMTISEAAGKIPYRTLGEMKSDHIVKVSIGGRRFEIVVAGDPLVSQALSGKLNPNSKDTWLQTLNRWRAGLFTSYNISFAARNLRKDSQYAQLNVMTNDGAFSKKYIKFLWHRGGALGMMDMLGIPHPGFVGQLGTAFRLRSMLKAYESGKPDAKLANSKTYKQFVEFMDNGGATGYAWSEDVRGARERFEKLYKQAARATLNPKNLGKLLKEFVSLTTGASELVQRFAVYQTEREFGGTISKAINRAKDVTLNFERKGAGMKIAGKNRNKLVNATAWANDIGRNYFMFFNANVQGKYQMAKLAKEHPARFTAAVAWPALLSAVILPILNEALLGGDDDESYYDLSEYDRQNFLCVRKPGGGWIKLPYSPELAPFAGVGDIIGASARGELTGNALWRSISKVSSAAASTCVDLDNVLAGGDKGEWEMRGRELLGSTALGPMADYMFNRNFMGGKVRKETYNEMQKNDPEYTKGTKRTNESLKWLTERLNRLTGGDNVDSGWVDVNPALLQTALEGYTGGWGSVALGITDFFATSGDKSLKIEQAPIVGGFMRSGGSNAREERVDQNYYRTVKKFMDEQHRRELRVNALLESNNEEDVFEGYAKSEKLANDKDYMKYNDFEQTGFADMIKQLEKLEKETGIEQPELRQYKEEAIKWFRNYE